jgi:protein-S-isoprenylcysteine O-methyltransferase Ste14
MWRYGVALAFLVGFGAWTLLRVRQEYRRQRRLSRTTAAAVWLLYTLHLAITAAAAVTARWPLPLDRAVGLAIGIALAGAGAVLAVGGAASFASLQRMSGLVTSSLVTTGIYRWSRNPQNVGWMLLLAGVSLAANSGLAMLMAAMFWVSFRFYLPEEERLLEHLFGDEYRRYRSRSRRYFGPPRTPTA